MALDALTETLQVQFGPSPTFEVDEQSPNSSYGWWISWSTDPVTGQPFNVAAGFDEAYYVSATYVGPDLMYAKVTEPYASTLTFPVSVDEFFVEEAWFVNLFLTAVGEFSGDDIYAGYISIGQLEEGEFDDSTYLTLDIGQLVDELFVSNADELFVFIDYAYGADATFYGTDGFTAFVDDFIDGWFEVMYSNDVAVTINNGNGSDISFYEVDGGQLYVAEGEVEVDVRYSDDVHVELGGGNDQVTVSQSGQDDEVVVLSGKGDDELLLSDSTVAYNPGAGRDSIEISGGQTIGNAVDGETDTFIFHVEDGGSHAVQADEFDEINLLVGNTTWSAEALDAIDAGGYDGVVEWNDFSLTYVESYDELKG